MKKKFKKLSLTTETLRNLSPSNLRDAVGADTVNVDPQSHIVTKCNTAACTFCTRTCTLCTRGCGCDTAPPCVP
jgi:hypothetical protein